MQGIISVLPNQEFLRGDGGTAGTATNSCKADYRLSYGEAGVKILCEIRTFQNNSYVGKLRKPQAYPDKNIIRENLRDFKLSPRADL